MNLENKINLVGDISIMSGAAAFAIVIFSIFCEIKYIGIWIFILMMIYSEMKIKYRDLRIKEIDEELENKSK